MASDLDADEYRTLLVAERDRLIERLAELGVVDAGRLNSATVLDSSQVTAWRNEGQSTGQRLHDLLEEVDGAIDRLDKGTYGVCEGCQHMIPPVRLEAMPASRLCIDCASR